jgi:fucose 4-O-acetylase-like acetyltransferase
MRELRQYEPKAIPPAPDTVRDFKNLDPAPGLPIRECGVDIARGLAILLMVFGHIWGGLMASGIISRTPIYTGLYSWIYAFHMPALMFMAGLFLVKSANHGLLPFVVRRFGTLYYPAVLWGLVTAVSLSTFRAYINTDPSRRSLWKIFYHPDSSYGFLLTLFYLSLIFACARAARITSWLLPPVAVAAWYLGLAAHNDVAIGFGSWGLWLTLGVVLRDVTLSVTRRSTSFLTGMAVVSGAVVTVGTALHQEAPPLICTPFGIVMLLACAGLLERSRLARVLEICGTRSLEIYLLHSLIWVACRIVLVHFLDIKVPEILVPVLLASGVAGSIAATRLAERLNMSWAFRLRLRVK